MATKKKQPTGKKNPGKKVSVKNTDEQQETSHDKTHQQLRQAWEENKSVKTSPDESEPVEQEEQEEQGNDDEDDD